MAYKKRFTQEVQEFIFDSVSRMKDDTVEKQIKVCNLLTDTNCYWVEHGLSKVIK
jgi:hypothetical protein